MQLTKPAEFTEAVQKLGSRSVIGSKLDSADWREMPLALADRAFFSSQIESVRLLQAMKDGLGDFLTGAREVLPDGQTALKLGSRAEFVKQMSTLSQSLGLGPLDPDLKGTLRDITSERRLGLIFDVQTQAAYDYGSWKQGQDPDILDEFPAQRFIRETDVTKPRVVHQQNEGVVKLKSDLDFWTGMNSPVIGGFGVPWGPWGFNSGMGVEDVDRAEAEALGLIQPGQKVEPVDKAFNEDLKASTRGLEPEMIDLLKGAFGDQMQVRDGHAVWQGSLIRDLVTRALSEPAHKADVSLGQATPRTIAAAQEHGTDLAGHELILTADDIRHAMKRHGPSEQLPGHEPLRPADFELIPWIWRAPDEVRPGEKPGSLVFIAQITGRLVAVTWERSQKRKLTGIKSVWMWQGKGKGK